MKKTEKAKYVCSVYNCSAQAHYSYTIDGLEKFCCSMHVDAVSISYRLLTGNNMPFTVLSMQIGLSDIGPTPVAWRQKRRHSEGHDVFDHDPREIHDNGMPVEPLYLKEQLQEGK